MTDSRNRGQGSNMGTVPAATRPPADSERRYGVTTDYEYRGTRQRLMIWEGAFWSVFAGEALSLPTGGYMVTDYNGKKVRVKCPSPRTDENWQQVDAAISRAMVDLVSENYYTVSEQASTEWPHLGSRGLTVAQAQARAARGYPVHGDGDARLILEGDLSRIAKVVG